MAVAPLRPPGWSTCCHSFDSVRRRHSFDSVRRRAAAPDARLRRSHLAQPELTRQPVLSSSPSPGAGNPHGAGGCGEGGGRLVAASRARPRHVADAEQEAVLHVPPRRGVGGRTPGATLARFVQLLGRSLLLQKLGQ
jgi:hypothetical protein